MLTLSAACGALTMLTLSASCARVPKHCLAAVEVKERMGSWSSPRVGHLLSRRECLTRFNADPFPTRFLQIGPPVFSATCYDTTQS